MTIAVPITRVGFAFVPKSDGGILTANLNLPVGTSLNQTNAATRKMEQYLLRSRSQAHLDQRGQRQQSGHRSATSGLTVTLIHKKPRAGIDDLVSQYQAATRQTAPGARIDTLTGRRPAKRPRRHRPTSVWRWPRRARRCWKRGTALWCACSVRTPC